LPTPAYGQILHAEDLNAGQEYDGVEVRNPFPT
jgi:hypothetical protein